MERHERQNNFLRKCKRVNFLFSHTLSDKTDPFHKFSDYEFKNRFKFEKHVVLNIIYPLVKEELTSISSCQFPPFHQLLVALRFYSCGSFQNILADSDLISQPSVHRIVRKVSVALAKRRSEFIKFPNSQNVVAVRSEFFKKAGFPGVIGAIDCSHIKIANPGGPSSEVFRNRKDRFSLNVQGVCDADLKFTNIVARWPGSTHDSRIFKCSKLRVQLEQNLVPRWLIGDRGYAIQPYLLTAFPKPRTGPERRYNSALKRTRSTIERTFGIWKKKFFCLSEKLRTQLSTSMTIVIACAVLHNIAIDFNQYTDDERRVQIIPDDPDQIEIEEEGSAAGRNLRGQIVAKYFT